MFIDCKTAHKIDKTPLGKSKSGKSYLKYGGIKSYKFIHSITYLNDETEVDYSITEKNLNNPETRNMTVSRLARYLSTQN